ncbi:Gamma-glutamylputrescine oxidoreductase [Achromobacter spanius]|uniref:NAD(P)/FAD-dependent oxidoreductase n=1 Tax=Achromobacter spanius TaxID=217203 RepID=UPI000C2BCBA6|nr:FAD-binding oxidoreductase [Achromobacter spanius]AUA56349.1 FAD-dependent oxidoreductase [Achromobacter spanius]CAB3690765.1 tRNA 5-methylaminomethyl-2-thiouridine biosynthesis bifunctional protein MnmC [Achromobacter spanius]SPT37796.1 Gamma-glutamylputrescine oxidoreductase [Achromobacter denitrificans]VEE56083.1 Gamma-glutamylputrescine oxidoreductase [Achromobacter spanius]
MTLNRREFILKTAAASTAASAVGALGLWPAASSALSSPLTTVPLGNTALQPAQLLQDARKTATRLGIDPRIWNWRQDASPSDPMPANYYEASLSEWPSFGTLPGDLDCEVVVIGGGLLGASTALHLAEAGVDVVLIEKDHIGSGASGRNGGQMTPGLARWEAGTMLDNLSTDEARRLWRFASVEAMETVDGLRDRYGFDCDRKRGHITAAVHAGHMGALVENADARRRLGDDDVKIIGRHELKEQYVKSDIYFGAAIDGGGGQVQPLALLRGLVHAFVKLGGRVYDNTSAQAIEASPGSTLVKTAQGAIKARRAVVLAVHSATFQFMPGSATTVPFFTYVAVTPPLGDTLDALIPSGLPVYDTQLQIDYYRPVRNKRLLFGGQGTGNSWSPRDVNNYLLDRIKTVFPQLEKPELEYSWSGISDLTLNGATDSRKSAGDVPVYMVHGWSGHGVAQTVRIGRAISDDLTGRNTDYAMLTRFDHAGIPLGRHLSPVAIPLIKGALGVMGIINPADMVSF